MVYEVNNTFGDFHQCGEITTRVASPTVRKITLCLRFSRSMVLLV